MLLEVLETGSSDASLLLGWLLGIVNTVAVIVGGVVVGIKPSIIFFDLTFCLQIPSFDLFAAADCLCHVQTLIFNSLKSYGSVTF